MKPWRVGRKVGRTIYEQQGPEPTDTDPLIGVMDTRELARAAVTAQNAMRVLAALETELETAVEQHLAHYDATKSQHELGLADGKAAVQSAIAALLKEHEP